MMKIINCKYLTQAIKFHQSGNVLDARSFYLKSLKRNSNHLVALKNLAVIEKQLGNFQASERIIKKAISISPRDPELHSNYGNILRALKEFKQAIKEFKTALELAPNFEQARMNLANCYAEDGAYDDAIRQVQEFSKDSKFYNDALIIFGKICSIQGRLDDAINVFSIAIENLGNNITLLNMRGSVYVVKKDYENALNDYRKILTIDPTNEEALYNVAALGQGDAVTTAPEGYVKDLFDAYAGTFDAHLVQSLKYKTPQLLYEQFIGFYKGDEGLEILDLGCGTGLAGASFEKFKVILDGVDLSEGMLSECAKKNIYNNLYCGEIVSFMNNSPTIYDLVICADVLVYLGDLADFFKALRRVTSKNGWVSLSVESSNHLSFELKPTKRFGHSAEYIKKLANESKFNIIDLKSTVIRNEAGSEITGYCILLRST